MMCLVYFVVYTQFSIVFSMRACKSLGKKYCKNLRCGVMKEHLSLPKVTRFFVICFVLMYRV